MNTPDSIRKALQTIDNETPYYQLDLLDDENVFREVTNQFLIKFKRTSGRYTERIVEIIFRNTIKDSRLKRAKSLNEKQSELFRQYLSNIDLPVIFLLEIFSSSTKLGSIQEPIYTIDTTEIISDNTHESTINDIRNGTPNREKAAIKTLRPDRASKGRQRQYVKQGKRESGPKIDRIKEFLVLYENLDPIYIAYVGMHLSVNTKEDIRETIKNDLSSLDNKALFNSEYKQIVILKREIEETRRVLDAVKKNTAEEKALKRGLMIKFSRINSIKKSIDNTPDKALHAISDIVSDYLTKINLKELTKRTTTIRIEGEEREEVMSIGPKFFNKKHLAKLVSSYLIRKGNESKNMAERSIYAKIQAWFIGDAKGRYGEGMRLLEPVIETVTGHRRRLRKTLLECSGNKGDDADSRAARTSIFGKELVKAIILNYYTPKDIMKRRPGNRQRKPGDRELSAEDENVLGTRSTNAMGVFINMASFLQDVERSFITSSRQLTRSFWTAVLVALIPPGARSQFNDWIMIRKSREILSDEDESFLEDDESLPSLSDDEDAISDGDTASDGEKKVIRVSLIHRPVSQLIDVCSKIIDLGFNFRTRDMRMDHEGWMTDDESLIDLGLSDVVAEYFDIHRFLSIKPFVPIGCVLHESIHKRVVSVISTGPLTDFCRYALHHDYLNIVKLIFDGLGQLVPLNMIKLDTSFEAFSNNIMVDILSYACIRSYDTWDPDIATEVFDIIMYQRDEVLRSKGVDVSASRDETVTRLLSQVYRSLAGNPAAQEFLNELFPEHSPLFNELAFVSDYMNYGTRDEVNFQYLSANFPEELIGVIRTRNEEQMRLIVESSVNYFESNPGVAQLVFDFSFGNSFTLGMELMREITGVQRPSEGGIRDLAVFLLMVKRDIRGIRDLIARYGFDTVLTERTVKALVGSLVKSDEPQEFKEMFIDVIMNDLISFSANPSYKQSIEEIIGWIIESASGNSSTFILLSIDRAINSLPPDALGIDKSVLDLMGKRSSNLYLLADRGAYIAIQAKEASGKPIEKDDNTAGAILYAILYDAPYEHLLRECYDWSYGSKSADKDSSSSGGYSIFRALGMRSLDDERSISTMKFFMEQRDHISSLLGSLKEKDDMQRDLKLLTMKRLDICVSSLTIALHTYLISFFYTIQKTRRVEFADIEVVDSFLNDVLALPDSLINLILTVPRGETFLLTKASNIGKQDKRMENAIRGFKARIRKRSCFLALKRFTANEPQKESPESLFKIKKSILELCSERDAQSIGNLSAIIRLFLLNESTRDSNLVFEFIKKGYYAGETIEITTSTVIKKDDDEEYLSSTRKVLVPVSRALIANINANKHMVATPERENRFLSIPTYQLQGEYDLISLFVLSGALAPDAISTFRILEGMILEYNRESPVFIDRFQRMLALAFNLNCFSSRLIADDGLSVQYMTRVYELAAEKDIYSFIDAALQFYEKKEVDTYRDNTQKLLRASFINTALTLSRSNVYLDTYITKAPAGEKLPFLDDLPGEEIDDLGFVVDTDTGRIVKGQNGEMLVVPASAGHVYVSSSLMILNRFMSVGFTLEEGGRPIALDLLASQRKSLNTVLGLYPSLSSYSDEILRSLIPVCLKYDNRELLNHLMLMHPHKMAVVINSGLKADNRLNTTLIQLIMGSKHREFDTLKEIMKFGISTRMTALVSESNMAAITSALRYTTMYQDLMGLTVRSVKAGTYYPNRKGEVLQTQIIGRGQPSENPNLVTYERHYDMLLSEDRYYDEILESYHTYMAPLVSDYPINDFMYGIALVQSSRTADAFVSAIKDRKMIELFKGMVEIDRLGSYRVLDEASQTYQERGTIELSETDEERIVKLIARHPHLLGALKAMEIILTEEEESKILPAIKEMFDIYVICGMAEPCADVEIEQENKDGLSLFKAYNNRNYAYLPSLLASGLITREQIEKKIEEIQTIQDKYANISSVKSSMVVAQVKGLIEQARKMPTSDDNKEKINFIRTGLSNLVKNRYAMDILNMIELNNNQETEKKREKRLTRIEKMITKTVSSSSKFYDPDMYCVMKDLQDFLVVADRLDKSKRQIRSRSAEEENFDIISVVNKAIRTDVSYIRRMKMSHYYILFVQRELRAYQKIF